MRKFRPTNYLNDEADDLEEAIRIALRKSVLDVNMFRYRRHWHYYAPKAWRVEAEFAPPGLVKTAQADLDRIDAMRREDESRCERIICSLLDAMRSDVFVAACLIEQIESEYEEGSIPREAVVRFREECRA